MQIADFHNDILTSGKFENLSDFYYQNKIVTAIFRGDRTFKQILPLAKKAKYLAFEDVGYDDIDEDNLISLNPVCVGLTWNGENKYGYGCDYSFGLKNKGIELVRKLNKCGIAIDTAHISKGGFQDIINSADKVVNTHACFNGVFKHKRNLDDWQIKLILEKNGLVGVTLCGYFMTNRKTCKIDDYIRNILYFYERWGADNLCLGTDFFGTDFLPVGLEEYGGFYLLKTELEKVGVKNEDIEKIFYKNLSRFLS